MPHQTYIIWLEMVIVGSQIYRHNKVVYAGYFHFRVQYALDKLSPPGNHLVIQSRVGGACLHSIITPLTLTAKYKHKEWILMFVSQLQ